MVTKNKRNRRKAQGALETLLLFGGAILLAAIVISLIVGLGSSSKSVAEENTTRAITMSDAVIPAILYSVSCADVNCLVAFQSFGGEHELVIDNDIEGRKEITNNKTTLNSALSTGKHSAYILTTQNGGSSKSNTYSWDVTTSTTPPETVETPSANPSSQVFLTNVSVNLSCTTSGATIHYTTNGSAPNCNSTQYSNTLLFTTTTTLKAIACKAGSQSAMMSETYTLTPPETVTLKFEPASGIVPHGQEIKLISNYPEAKIFYTFDGSIPDEHSINYENIKIEEPYTIIKAIAIFEENNSGVKTESYTLEGYVATPVASPGSGKVSPGTKIELSTTTPGAKIFYVINDGNPKEGQPYTEPIPVTEENCHIIAIAELGGVYSEDVLDAVYEIGAEVLTPYANPTTEDYENIVEVKLFTDTHEAKIFYTLDGSAPTVNSFNYQDPIEITQTTTLKAIAFFEDTSSGVMTETYTIK